VTRVVAEFQALVFI